MMYEDERSEAEDSIKTLGERLSAKLSDGFSRITSRFDESMKGISDHFTLLKERVRQDRTRKPTPQETIEKYFGKASYMTRFTFEDLVRWLMGKREGCNVVVFKLDDEKMRELFGSNEDDEFSLGDDKYIAALVMDGEKIKYRFLVQYETLDEQLEEVLANGDYVL